jgi:hypothetical protein
MKPKPLYTKNEMLEIMKERDALKSDSQLLNDLIAGWQNGNPKLKDIGYTIFNSGFGLKNQTPREVIEEVIRKGKEGK